MDKFVIEGGVRLQGELDVKVAKNALLPCLAATLLTEEAVTFEKSANLIDIYSMVNLLTHLGVEFSGSIGEKFTVKSSNINSYIAPYDLVRKMRASILVLGPLLARFKKAKVSFPGGCAIGARPIDQHLKGLLSLGAKIDISEGYIIAETDGLKGNEVVFDKVTVGGTENILMAAVLAEGRTTIYNAAREPEVVDLGNMLIKMGAKIEGLGSDKIVIEGVKKLDGVNYINIPDRIECGTLLCAAAITGGKVTLTNSNKDIMESTIIKLAEMGLKVSSTPSTITIESDGIIKPVDITTAPYPGFPTDLQAQFVALLTQAEGVSTVKEEIFESRFLHILELERLGADIKLEGNVAIIKGPTKLKGAEVMASDLRASASLIIAGLSAEGKTTINRIYHLDRGYEKFEERLKKLGAKIERVK